MTQDHVGQAKASHFVIAHRAWIIFIALMVLTVAAYRPGLNGTYLFDDYPNIVDNPGVKPANASMASLARAALSSPSSEFKRPLSSLTFGANYLATGLDPYWMKFTNLLIHLLNGFLVFLVARRVLQRLAETENHGDAQRADISAALVAGAWLLLPINLTGVLYVVQRMESLANLFVLAGLLGYLRVRSKMQTRRARRDVVLAICWLVVPTGLGLLAKETAVMLPLYAFAAEVILYRLKSYVPAQPAPQRDLRIQFTYVCILLIPMVVGLAWILPGLLRASGWSTRDFTLSTRLLTEARVVMDYLGWTVLPTPEALSFYHDDFAVSRNLISPWTTLTSVAGVTGLLASTCISRRRFPTIALGLAWFVACQLLTSTILPLELVYEHRNYFASVGVLIAVVPPLAQPSLFAKNAHWMRAVPKIGPFILTLLFVTWTAVTGITAAAWGTPLSLAIELAARAPASPRAQYELGRTFIILSGYDPASPFAARAYAPLEAAAAIPGSGILPEQALIFFNARMHRNIKNEWWDSIERKLRTRKVTVQDESALASLVQCKRTDQCDLPTDQLTRAFLAALSHPERSARLIATYGDFAWNELNDHTLGLRMLKEAIAAKPGEPAYRVSHIRMLLAEGRNAEARSERNDLAAMNIGGALNDDITGIDKTLSAR